MSELQQLDRVKARFAPKRLDDLKPEATQFIGEIAEFQVVWEIEAGPYSGQWALMAPREWSARTDGAVIWLPECDLELFPTTRRD